MTTTPAPEEAQASRPVLNPAAPRQYVVQRGDTLWDIASKFLRDPWYWPEIWYVNPQIENPHLIYPGDTLSLGVGANGQPIVSLTRGADVRLSPQMRASPLSDAIKAIPYEVIASFMSKPSVLEKDEAKTLPYVVAVRDQHVVAGVGNEVYAKNLTADQNARFNIVHVGDPLVDPENNDTVGYQGIYTASARVERPGDPSKLVLTESARETRDGDRLIGDSLDVPLDFVPHAPEQTVNGRIMSVIDGVTNIGAFQVVVVNRGSRNGLEPGHVLAVMQRGEKVRDPTSSNFGKKVQLPDERAGTFMVFKTYDRISYGLIMTADHPLHVGDAVANP
ncbi:MAG: LysM peptidoglycan-binding domain-containing protein [Steroidobacterales bacterium]